MSLPAQDAVTRFEENEVRLDTFLNALGIYTTRNTVDVETIPSLMARLQSRYLSVLLRGDWVTATVYGLNDVVKSSGILYICPTAHTSGTFATDLAAGKWAVYQGTLDSDLASYTDALKGAGKVGYSSSLSYAANTEGHALNEINTKLSNLSLHGQCILTWIDSHTLKLSRWNGKTIIIDNVLREIPSTGVTLSETGLTAGTLYYIYAYMSSGTMTLEAVTTVYEVSSANGVKIKTGDASRTLVGIEYMTDEITPTIFVEKYTSSYFNRKTSIQSIKDSTGRTTTATSAEDYNSGSHKFNFVAWAGDVIESIVTGDAKNSTSASSLLQINDGTGDYGYESRVTSTAYQSISTSYSRKLIADGLYYVTPRVYVSSASTGTYLLCHKLTISPSN